MPGGADFAVCPGNNNGCSMPFRDCTAERSSNEASAKLCRNISAVIPDGGMTTDDMFAGSGPAPMRCTICCR